MAKRDWKEDEIIRNIKKNGIDFPVTNEIKENLRKEGASDQLIQALVDVSPPVPAPEPKGPQNPTGTLVVQCAPAECSIKINGQEAGNTVRGTLSLPSLPVGRAVVDFSHPGYMGKQDSVEIKENASVSVSATLEPDYATQSEFGKRALQAMLASLGVAKNPGGLWVLSGTGSATSWDSAGKESEWNIDFAFAPPNLLRMDARGSGNVSLACRGDTCEQKKKSSVFGGKRASDPVADSLALNLRQFARCHFAVMLSQLTTPGNHVLALSFDPSTDQDQRLNVQTSDVIYDVILGPQARLASIVAKPRSGLGGLTITYGAYVKIGEFYYPRHTTVKLQGQGQHGIAIRFEAIQQESKLHEKDFPQ